MEDMKPKGDSGPNPLEVMGLFWIALGIIMVVAVYAPPTMFGKLTNLAAGVILLAIGLIALLKGRAKRISGEIENE
ncbi:MAG: hypothetical protein KAS72_09280 [Phycisphaerales bacterium]|nr:hypothetical protein [Phycisphaerales bacterium]